MKLLYLANMRIPTEKAHGLQIMQNCEAFAALGVEVTLWAARRVNTPELRDIGDYWAHYGVAQNFRVRRLPCLDLQAWAGDARLLVRLTFFLQALTYTLAALIGALFTRADAYYSRDLATVLALSVIKPRHNIAYEVHRYSRSRIGRWGQRTAVRRAGSVIAITPTLRDDLQKLQGLSDKLKVSSDKLQETRGKGQRVTGASAKTVATIGDDDGSAYQQAEDDLLTRGLSRLSNPHESKFLVAHDGIRSARFANMPTQAAARQALGWTQDAFIVGYVGRLETLSMDKGVGLLVDALAEVGEAQLALVGGPDATAEQLRARWLRHGLPAEAFRYAGQVAPAQVALYLAAFDLCAMPHPFTQQFAYYTSPLKLFEYMASGRAIIASDLPGWADVVTHELDALLIPTGEGAVSTWTDAVRRLRADPALRQRLGDAARERVFAHYTWDARARAIWAHIQRGG